MWPALIAAGGTVLGSIIGGRSARAAADTQADAARQTNELQRYMYDTTRADAAPYRQQGQWALQRYRNLLQNPGQIRRDPGYQFGLNMGIRALDRSAAARGMTMSGAQMQALNRYGQDYGQGKLDDSLRRLSVLAGLAQPMNSATNVAGMNYANNAGNALMSAGDARAASQLAQGSIYGNALTQFAANPWWMQQQRASFGPQLDGFFSGTGGSGD